jgi:hypothetical protein
MTGLSIAGAVGIALLSATTLCSQDDPFAPLRFFEGKWQGSAAGEPGKGVSTRQYQFDLNGRFLSVRNRSVWEPKAPGGKGEIHEDFGMFSYDKALKKLVLRQFHVEGFVNEYTMESASPDGRTLTFTTVRIENIPAGYRARESYRLLKRDEFIETFSLAEPGKDFERYSETRFRRVN